VLQRATPEHAHGRVLAVDMVAGNGAMFFGTVLGGPLIGAVEVQGAVLIMGGFALIAGLGVLSGDPERAAGGEPAIGHGADRAVRLRPKPPRRSQGAA